MARKSFKVAVLIVTLLTLIVPSYSFAKGKKGMEKPSAKTVELRLALRDLWTDHIFWVRNVVVATKNDDKDAAKIAEGKVVENAKALANSISPYYGQAASEKLFGLLAGHYGAIKDYMNASFSGSKEAKDSAGEKLKNNADEIATFLSSANPNWPKDVLLSALLAHGGHHMAQIDEISIKDFSGEANTWEAMKNHVYVIADVLANGIAKQFPKKF